MIVCVCGCVFVEYCVLFVHIGCAGDMLCVCLVWFSVFFVCLDVVVFFCILEALFGCVWCVCVWLVCCIILHFWLHACACLRFGGVCWVCLV